MRRLTALLDPNGKTMFGLQTSDYVDHAVLVASTPKTHAIPAGARSVLFTSTAAFYCKIGGVAALPTIDVTNGSGCMFNPELRSLDGATFIGLVSSSPCIVTMEFFS